MDIKFSVIMPVYNSEKTLDTAIKSVLNDKNENVELVVVNDGSTDKSEEIIKKYITDPRLSYYYQENSGVSAARNFGLTVAKGEYIAFLDSDDYFAEDAFVKLIKYANEYNSDLIGFGYYSESYSKQNKHISTHPNSLSKLLEFDVCGAEESLEYIFRSSKVLFQTAWSKVYKKSIVEKNRIKFDVNLVCYEDMKFVLDYMVCCKKIVFVSDILYRYCGYGSGGSALQKRKQKELTSNASACFASFLKLADKYNYSNKFRNFMYEQFFADFTYCSQKVFLPENEMSTQDRVKLFSDFLDDEMFLFLKENYFGSFKFYKILYLLHDNKLDYLAYLLYKNKIVRT